MQLPSSIPFVSLFQYSPRGTASLSGFSKQFTYAIKQDSFVTYRDSKGDRHTVRAIPQVADSIASRIGTFPFLADCFGDDTLLVPLPRSSPLVKGGLWPAERLCQAMVARGLAKAVFPCIERSTSVAKSATAKSGERPGPEEHYRSCTVAHAGLFAASASKLTLVDDVVTRGSTFLGLYALLFEAFPQAQINCFAAVRTESSGDIAALPDPVEGTISYTGGILRRRP